MNDIAKIIYFSAENHILSYNYIYKRRYHSREEKENYQYQQMNLYLYLLQIPQ